MALEHKLRWIELVLPLLAKMYPKTKLRILAVQKVLEYGKAKHKESNTAIREHLEHALNHLEAHTLENSEKDSGLPHMAHASARCLLAFGQAIGLTWSIKR